MRKNFKRLLCFGLMASSFLACKKEDKYDSSVVRSYSFLMNGQAYEFRSGDQTRPILIYKSNGDFLANYGFEYNFTLENGLYEFVATNLPSQLVPLPVNLNELTIPQDKSGSQEITISAPTAYRSPFQEELVLDIKTRTGELSLQTLDVKADRSYAIVRTVVSVKRVGFNVWNETFALGKLDVVREKGNVAGGTNYKEEFTLLTTEGIAADEVQVSFQFLDQDSVVIKEKSLAGTFSIYADSVVSLTFNLNDTNAPVIQDYELTIKPAEWTEEELFPDIPVIAPKGYTYVGPADNLDAVFNAQKEDESVETIKIFLKAGETYELKKNTLNDLKKGFSLLAQKPVADQEKTKLKISGSVSLGENTGIPTQLSMVHFENLNITQGGRFFYFKNQDFEIQDIKFIACDFTSLPDDYTLWYQIADGDYMQVCHNFTIDGCSFIQLDLGKSALLGLGNKQILPIYNITMKNSTFHMKDLSSPLITNLHKIDKTLRVSIENCTFVNMVGGDNQWFNLDAKATELFELTVRNNLLSGVSSVGQGTWLSLRNVSEGEISNNYTTSDYILNNWGVDSEQEPIISKSDINSLFQDASTGNLKVNASSDIYLNKIGDPKWLK
ncbi:MAG: DUF5123 domain-containing protein [Bacteroidales bacterium]